MTVGVPFLHAIPLPSGGDIDHVVIGPAGGFAITTKHHSDAKITVGTHLVWVNGAQYPYQRKCAQEGKTAQRHPRAAP